MSLPNRRRGEPLLLLALVLGTWVGGRAATWRSPFPEEPPSVAAFAAIPADHHAATAVAGRPAPLRKGSVPVYPAAMWPVQIERATVPAAPDPWSQISSTGALPRSSRLAPAQQLLLMAGLGYAALPEAESAARPREVARRWAPPLLLARSGPPARSRWSGDGWLLVRGGDYPRGTAGGGAGYGGSQAGAVLRFHLAPSSGHRPAAYLRLSGALDPGGDREAAVGASVRPLSAVPFLLLAEGRVQQAGGSYRLRPAVALVSEFPPLSLPLGAELEAYGQAGYVAGRNATAFYDAQATIDRPFASFGRDATLRVGGGAWAGGQEGANRLDVGPRASVRFDLGKVGARASADWRFRVAGNAAPGSGPALTLSAGF